MIIGFGFGSPLTALFMLVITGFLSYFLYKWLRELGSEKRSLINLEDREGLKEKRREYYFEQRRKAREMIGKYDLSDEEIENIIEKELEKET